MRRPTKMSPELRAAIELQNKANKIAGVESRTPMRVRRAEANAVRRELKHDAGMTKKQRARAERIRQGTLTIQRARNETVKRVGDILAGLPGTEKKTELGIVLPSGRQIGEILSGVSGKAV